MGRIAVTPSTAGADQAAASGRSFDSAHQALAADKTLQFEMKGIEPPPPPPGWLQPLADFLQAMGPLFKIIFWVGLAAIVLAILWFIGRELIRIRLPERTDKLNITDDASRVFDLFRTWEERILRGETPVEVQAASQKIAMTAPVETQASNPGKWTIRFMMPSEYTLATLPKPKNPQVQIREVPANRRAVIVFSGRWTDANFSEHSEILERFLKSRSLTAKGPLLSARYNAPFTPWFLRHNEIQAEI